MCRKHNGLWVQVGVASIQQKQHLAAVFTKISSFYDFIISSIGDLFQYLNNYFEYSLII